MEFSDSDFELGVHLGRARAASAFGSEVLGLEIDEGTNLLRGFLVQLEPDRLPHPRFIIFFVDLGVTGYIARMVTGEGVEYNEGLAEGAWDVLNRLLNSWTHDHD